MEVYERPELVCDNEMVDCADAYSAGLGGVILAAIIIVVFYPPLHVE